MFEYLRKNASSSVVKVALGIVALVFVFWGVGSFAKKDSANYAAIVNNETLSLQEFSREFDNFIKNYESQYNMKIDEAMIKNFHLKENIVNSLINKILIHQEAVKMGINVSDDELKDIIVTIEAFKDNGGFSKERYHQVLQMNRITPEDFEKKLKFDIAINKFQNSIANSILITDQEAKLAYELNTKRAKLGFVKIPFDKFVSQVKYTDADITAYFDKNKEMFKTPETRDVAFVSVDKDYILKSFKLSDDDIKKYYDENKDQFSEKEQIKARHILFKTTGDSTHDKEALKKAETVLKEVKSGGNFPELAKKYSDCPSKVKGGDLGYFSKGQMVPEFEKAAFSLKKDQISEIVKTNFGYHIIKVEDIKPSSSKTFEQAKPLIKSQLEQNYISLKMKEISDSYAQKLDNSSSLESIAKDLNLQIASAEKITLNSKKFLPDFISKIFKAEENVIQIIEGSPISPLYFAKVVKIDKPYIPDFNNIKDTVIKEYKNVESEKMAKDAAATLITSSKTLQALKEATKNIYTYDATDFINFYSPKTDKLKDIDLSEIKVLKVKDELLNHPLSNRDAAFVIGVTEFENFDNAKFEKEKEQYIKMLTNEKMKSKMDTMIEDIRKNSKIRINEKILG